MAMQSGLVGIGGGIPIVSPGVLEGREERGIGFSGVVELYPK